MPVLMYHAVGRPLDTRFRPWTISPTLLAEQLACLREAGYELVGMTEWASQLDVRKRAVLTFDDGYSDFIDLALPILLAHRARATAYIVTAYVGKSAQWLPFRNERRRPIMEWSDLASARDHGIEIGSHGHQHIELDAVSPLAAADDVRKSRAALTRHSFSANSFCYPYGYANRTVRDIVADAGFTSACVVGRGLADSDRDLLRVRRLAVGSRTTPESLLQLFRGPAIMPTARVRAAAQPVWRLTRRTRSMVRGTLKPGRFSE